METVDVYNYLRLSRVLFRSARVLQTNGRKHLLILIIVYNKANRLLEAKDKIELNKSINRIHLKTAINYLLKSGFLINTSFRTKFKLTESGEYVVRGFLQYYEEHQK